jgi:hypothetical protein
MGGPSTGGVGPAGIKKDGTYGTKVDASRTARRNELRTAIKKFEPLPIKIIKGFVKGQKKSKQNVLDYEGQAAGVTPERAPKDARTGRDNDGGNNNNQQTQKSIEQPKVASQMDNTEVKSDLITADKTAPTDVEMTDDELLLKRKRGRKTKTVLTSVTGDTSKATLSKKTLLG